MIETMIALILSVTVSLHDLGFNPIQSVGCSLNPQRLSECQPAELPIGTPVNVPAFRGVGTGVVSGYYTGTWGVQILVWMDGLSNPFVEQALSPAQVTRR